MEHVVDIAGVIICEAIAWLNTQSPGGALTWWYLRKDEEEQIAAAKRLGVSTYLWNNWEGWEDE